MGTDTISVVIPAYNTALWLSQCLDSLLAQTHEKIEIIVVDDGSQDDTLPIIQKYAARDSRVKAIHKKNGGVTSARLRGIAEATGDWIGFVDSDDEIEPQMYARLLENAHSFCANISHCSYRRDYADGRVEYKDTSREMIQNDRLQGLQSLLEERRFEPGLCSKLFHRSLFWGLEEKMDLSIKNNEDMLMNYYLFSQATSSVYEGVCPYHYKMRDNSASHRKLNEHRIYDPIRVREIILESCDTELKEDAKQALLRAELYVYALLTVETDKEYRIHRKTIRNKIVGHRDYFSVLTKRNQLLAHIICVAPWIFQMAFRAYAYLLRGGKYE